MRRRHAVKMKVRVDKLQEAIHKHIAQDEKRFERETKEYKEKHQRAIAKHVDNLESYLKELRAGAEPRDSYDLRSFLDRGVKWPPQPREAATHKELLVKLDLAEDQVLTVDDHSDYMKFLDGKCVCR